MLYYAQLNINDECIGIQKTEKPIFQQNLIPIQFYDESLLNKIYNKELKIFEENNKYTLPKLSNQEIMPNEYFIDQTILELIKNKVF